MRRRILLTLGLAGLAFYAGLAVLVYRFQTDAEFAAAWDGPWRWIFGPPARVLNRLAREEIERGLQALHDPDLAPAQALARHREALRRAEELLVRSLRAQPIQARTMARLVAIRWELDPPLTPEAIAERLEHVALASRMAPRNPDVQLDLARLLLQAGQRDAALDYLARTVNLDPRRAGEVVSLAAQALFEPEEIRAALPDLPEVLAALAEPYAEAGMGERWLAAVEARLAQPGVAPVLPRAYGQQLLERPWRDPARLERAFRACGPWGNKDAELERLRLLARAALALGRGEEAIGLARQALALEPERRDLDEELGALALQAGRPAEAIQAFEEALRKAGEAGAPASERARLHRRIGQALEARGQLHLAYQAYRRALRLWPEDRAARQRVEAFERDAGLVDSKRP